MTAGRALAAEHTGAAFAGATVKIRDAEFDTSVVDPVAVSETATSVNDGVNAGGNSRTVAVVVSPAARVIGDDGVAEVNPRLSFAVRLNGPVGP